MSDEYYSSINNPITFSSDEKLVKSYKFNLTYDELINNSKRTRLARKNKKNGTNIIPRRQNAWILYLRDKSSSSDISGFQSKLIAKMWSEESKEVVEVYEAAARLAVNRHIEKYGEILQKKSSNTSKSSKSSNFILAKL